LIETTADDFCYALGLGTNSTIAFLQTLHNDALGMGWIPIPIVPRKRWPKMKKKPRRAVTLAEHNLMVESLSDSEWCLYLLEFRSAGRKRRSPQVKSGSRCVCQKCRRHLSAD